MSFKLATLFNLKLKGEWDCFWFQGVQGQNAEEEILDLQMHTEQLQESPSLVEAASWQICSDKHEAIQLF
jgi:hypothetical protein